MTYRLALAYTGRMSDKAAVRSLAQALADELMREFRRCRIAVDTESPPEHEDAYLWLELDGSDYEELRELWRLAVLGCQRLNEEHEFLVVPRLRRGPTAPTEDEDYAGGEAQYWQR